MKKSLSLLLALCLMLSGAALAENAPQGEASYTYNNSLAAFPNNWNPHQYKTDIENASIMKYISDGLYDFDYNEAGDSYALVNHHAVGDPVDVTSDYVGEEWGIPEGAAARAWKFTIRDDLKWQDGTPITAQTYVTSAKLQLDPLAKNYRADALYAGSFVLHNAEAYAKQGSAADTSISAYMKIAGANDLDAFFKEYGQLPGYVNWSGSFGNTYDFDKKAWTGAAEDAVVETPLTIQELYAFYTEGEGGKFITWADEATKKEWALDELFAKYTYPEIDFEKVGIKAVSDYEVVFILDKTLEGFYLKYTMDIPLVHEEMYNACATVSDGVYTNSYGTSAETTMSYGPYMLTSFQSDKEIVLEKNPNWYGYHVPEWEGLYQTTKIHTSYVAEASTAFEMFLNGQLDVVSLDVDHINDYATSDYAYYDESPSVFAMALNPDLEALTANQKTAGENINKTMLTVKEFRMALSLGIDRSAFILATNPSATPAFALYGNTIVGNPETATFYRSTEAAKKVIVDFWGLSDEIGQGKMYATMDEAIESISGYNLEMAKEYFNLAYDKAIAEGLMDENDVVEIIIGLPATRPAYVNGYEFIVNNYTEAVKGTKLEGKLTFKQDATIGDAFADALRNNQVDMLFYVGWNGVEFDPYSLMEAYVSNTYQYDPSWDSKAAMVDIEIGGQSYTASAYDWYKAMNNTPITAVKTGTEETAELVFPYSMDEEKASQRLDVLAALENVVLQNYDFIPMTTDASAKLKGMQIEYLTEDEIFPMSRGGIRYMTYNYTDAEWDAFVAEQGGTLNYK